MRLLTRRPWSLVLLVAAVSLVAACGPSGPSAAPSSTTADTRPSAAASHAPAASPSTAPATAAASNAATTTQTDTAWGRIWDALPTGFPTFPGSTPADDAGIKDVSATWAVTNGQVKDIADWFQAELEGATFSTEALSGPAEDGSYVLDSLGVAGCKIETVIAPTGGLTLISVKYGAACPNT